MGTILIQSTIHGISHCLYVTSCLLCSNNNNEEEKEDHPKKGWESNEGFAFNKGGSCLSE